MVARSDRNQGDGPAAALLRLASSGGACAVLACWYVLMYGDCTRQFFHWDDFWLLGDASRLSIHRPIDLWRLFRPGRMGFLLYRPLSQVGYFWLLEQLFGYDAAPYHAVQLCAHVANATLVYAIASTILHSRGAGLGTALVYAAGPGHAIAVYWNAAFSMTGTAFWYFACLLAWLRSTGWRRQVMCAALFVVSLLHGEAAITIPLALTLSLLIEKAGARGRRVWELLPVYIIAAGYAAGKAWYLWFGLVKDFPDPMGRAWVMSHYGPTFTPAGTMQALGFYCACCLSWLYRAVGSVSMLYGLAALCLVGLTVAGFWARRSAEGRVVAFGLSFFIVALSPVLSLPQHRYMYLIGVAALGSSLAVVAAARAVPRVGPLLTIGVVAATLVVEVASTAGVVRDSAEFRFMSDFQVKAASWLQAVERQARAQPGTEEVIVPSLAVTDLVFKDAQGHRLFYGATYEVRVVDAAQRFTSSPTRLVLAPFGRPGTELPGQQPQWNWLRWGARFCARNAKDSSSAAAEPTRGNIRPAE